MQASGLLLGGAPSWLKISQQLVPELISMGGMEPVKPAVWTQQDRGHCHTSTTNTIHTTGITRMLEVWNIDVLDILPFLDYLHKLYV